jgi:catechol 2,3-dioxygenase-like lactoylglutathione lyase family enzyme
MGDAGSRQSVICNAKHSARIISHAACPTQRAIHRNNGKFLRDPNPFPMSIVRSLAVAALVAFPTCLTAQAAESPFATARGAFFALSVRDLQATVNWYSQKLGLRNVMTIPRTGRIAGGAALEGDGILVELIQHEDAKARVGVPELTHGIAKAGVIVADFDRAVAALRARGIEITGGPYPARPNQRANLMFRDNEGNYIQILGPYR